MIEAATIAEALHYILDKTRKAGSIKLIKLLYLADKYHLLRYGRTVTNDDYYAMEFGPVGTTVKDILTFDKKMLAGDYKIVSKLIVKNDDEYTPRPAVRSHYDHLSETDREALDFVIVKFGKQTGKQLTNYTHRYPEWARHAHLFKGRTARGRMRIEPEELLSVIDDDCFGVTPEHVEESRRLLTGTFD